MDLLKFLKDNTTLAPFLGAFIVLLTFIANIVINRIFQKEQIRREWYTKFLIEPNLKKIDEFYKNTCELYENSSILFKVNHDINIQVAQSKKFQDLKEEFESDIISIICSSKQASIFRITNQVIVPLSDIFIGDLANSTHTEDEVKNTLNKLRHNKSKLIEILFKPIK